MKQNWKEDEVEFLEDAWGRIKIPTIAKKLNRSMDAIKQKARKLNLGNHMDAGEEITFNQLLKALGLNQSFGYYCHSFITHKFPMKLKVSVSKKIRVVDLTQFWKWAEKNKNVLNFARFEKHALGKEPTWVDLKRKADLEALRYNKKPWTQTEDGHLILLLNEYKYGYAEMAEKLLRTEGAIKRRMYDLGIKQRPIKAENHIPWENEKIETAIQLYQQGFRPEYISKKVGRSACAVRGLLERTILYKNKGVHE